MSDAIKNFAKSTISTGYNSAATSIVLTTGGGAKFPTPPFNAVWWNSTDYTDPADDPNVEVVRVTAISTDTFTVTRAQESTSASNKNTGGKTYTMIQAPTALSMTQKAGLADANTFTAANVFSAGLTAGGANLGFGTETNPQFPFIFSSNATTGVNSGNSLGISAFGGPWLIGATASIVGWNVLNVAAASANNNFFRIDGTVSSPSNLANAEIIGALNFGGWGAAAAQGGRAQMLATTLEAWTATFGAGFQFNTTAAGASRAQAMYLKGGIIVGAGSTDPGAGNLQASGKLTPGSFTVGTLPAGSNAGDTVYASNCRVFNGGGTQEGAGAGTGGLVSYNGSAWKIAGTNVTAVA
jgi:hypothetical protein